MNKSKKIMATAISTYIAFFLCGIDLSIVAQYKVPLAHVWGLGNNIAGVLSIMSVGGFGGIIASFFTGLISDKFSRKFAAEVGLMGWVIFAFGNIWAPNIAVAYAVQVIGGVSNSFMNAGFIPTLMEAYPENRSTVTIMTKFFVSFGQFILPFFIIALAASHLPFQIAFTSLGIIYLILIIICFFAPFPQSNKEKSDKPKEKKHFRITPESIALGLMGFGGTAIFILWTQTNQELGLSYGMKSPALLQSIYAVCSLISVLVTSYLISKKNVRETTILISYPMISALGLLFSFFVQKQFALFITSGIIGWFGAGGLLQLAMSLMASLYPDLKATATSLLGIMNAVSNWLVIQVASTLTAKFGAFAPRAILLFNVLICIFAAVLGLIIMCGQNRRKKNHIDNLEY